MRRLKEAINFLFTGEVPKQRVTRVSSEVPEVSKPLMTGLQKVEDVLIGTRVELVDQQTYQRLDGDFARLLCRGKLVYMYVKVGNYKAAPQYNLHTNAGTITKLSPDTIVYVPEV